MYEDKELEYKVINNVYNTFSNSGIDPYDKLVSKNNSINDEYLEDFVHSISKFDLQNCNFVENTTPKVYEGKTIKPSVNYSTRRLNALSPNIYEYNYDNNDLLNDYTHEKDIRYDMDKLKGINMDYSYLQYHRSKGPDNAVNDFFEWKDPPNFSDAIYKKSEIRRSKNDIEFRETETLDNFNVKTKGKNNSLNYLSNDRIFNMVNKSDLDMYDSNNSQPYSNNKHTNEKQLLYHNIVDKTEINLPVDRSTEYVSRPTDKPTTDKTKEHMLSVSDRLPNTKEIMQNTNNRNITPNDNHIRNYVANALVEILHNDLDDNNSYTGNRNPHTTYDMRTTNFNEEDNIKYGLKESMDTNTNSNYGRIKEAVSNFIYHSYAKDPEYKHSKMNEMYYTGSSNVNSRQHELNNNALYSIIKEEYSKLRDKSGSGLIKTNVYNKSPNMNMMRPRHSTESRHFNYSEYINANDRSSSMNMMERGSINRNKAVDEAIYDESIDTNLSRSGNSKYNTLHKPVERHNIQFDDLSFGSFS